MNTIEIHGEAIDLADIMSGDTLYYLDTGKEAPSAEILDTLDRELAKRQFLRVTGKRSAYVVDMSEPCEDCGSEECQCVDHEDAWDGYTSEHAQD